MFPLSTMVLEKCMRAETVTVTKTVTIYQTIQTTITGYCEFTKEVEYLEPPRNNPTRVEIGGETIISDGTLGVHVPLMVLEPRISLTFEDEQSMPLWVLVSYVEYMIVNATENGVRYRQINYRAVYAVPTTTIPPSPPDCMDKKPPSTRLEYYDTY